MYSTYKTHLPEMHDAQNDSKTPNVNRVIVWPMKNFFRCIIVFCATVRVRAFLPVEHLSTAKVTQNNVSIRSDHDVFRFDVAVHNAQRV